MNLQTVEKLLEAGFTADEIRGMSQDPAPAPATDPAPAPATDPAPAPATDPAPAPAPATDPAPAPATDPAPAPAPATDPAPANNGPKPEDITGKRLDTIETALTALVKTIQSQNLLRDGIPGGNTKTMQQVTDEAMASLIRTPKQN